MERVCFLHIGTHKTGTTSLQLFLRSNDQSLERQGILFPRHGRPDPGSGGQHNLAWELSGDPRYRAAYGTWREVLDEIGSSEASTVCLSSEDLGLLYQQPQSLCSLRSELNAIGCQVRIVVYLRPQADCVESAYAELARNRVPVGFREYLERSIPRDPSQPRGLLAYPFDYREMLAPYAEAFGRESIIARAYKANRRANWLIGDFLSVISPQRKIRGLSYKISRARHNLSLNFAQVVERTLAQQELDRAGGVDGAVVDLARGRFMKGRFDPLDLQDLLAIRRRLREANQDLYRQYRIKVPTMSSGRLLREVLCSMGLNRASRKRKAFLTALDQSSKRFTSP